MKTLLTSLLLLSLTNIAYAGNSVFIEQIGTSTDSTITVDIDGNNNAVNLTMEGTDNELDITQNGNNNTVSWVSYWGSGRNWGGDLDGNNNTIKIEQHNTTGSTQKVDTFSQIVSSYIRTCIWSTCERISLILVFQCCRSGCTLRKSF